MRQIQLFSRSQIAEMRDRTAARNYSAEADRFRRVHARHRDWGLAQRHGEKLRRIRAERAAAATEAPAVSKHHSVAGAPPPSTPQSPQPAPMPSVPVRPTHAPKSAPSVPAPPAPASSGSVAAPCASAPPTNASRPAPLALTPTPATRKPKGRRASPLVLAWSSSGRQVGSWREAPVQALARLRFRLSEAATRAGGSISPGRRHRAEQADLPAVPVSHSVFTVSGIRGNRQ
jgi:hypothetical protein